MCKGTLIIYIIINFALERTVRTASQCDGVYYLHITAMHICVYVLCSISEVSSAFDVDLAQQSCLANIRYCTIWSCRYSKDAIWNVCFWHGMLRKLICQSDMHVCVGLGNIRIGIQIPVLHFPSWVAELFVILETILGRFFLYFIIWSNLSWSDYILLTILMMAGFILVNWLSAEFFGFGVISKSFRLLLPTVVCGWYRGWKPWDWSTNIVRWKIVHRSSGKPSTGNGCYVEHKCGKSL